MANVSDAYRISNNETFKTVYVVVTKKGVDRPTFKKDMVKFPVRVHSETDGKYDDTGAYEGYARVYFKTNRNGIQYRHGDGEWTGNSESGIPIYFGYYLIGSNPKCEVIDPKTGEILSGYTTAIYDRVCYDFMFDADEDEYDDTYPECWGDPMWSTDPENVTINARSVPSSLGSNSGTSVFEITANTRWEIIAGYDNFVTFDYIRGCGNSSIHYTYTENTDTNGRSNIVIVKTITENPEKEKLKRVTITQNGAAHSGGGVIPGPRVMIADFTGHLIKIDGIKVNVDGELYYDDSAPIDVNIDGMLAYDNGEPIDVDINGTIIDEQKNTLMADVNGLIYQDEGEPIDVDVDGTVFNSEGTQIEIDIYGTLLHEVRDTFEVTVDGEVVNETKNEVPLSVDGEILTGVNEFDTTITGTIMEQ